MILKPLGTEVSFDTTVTSPNGLGDNISSSKNVYICNTDTTNVHTVTVKDENDVTLSSFSVPPSSFIFLAKAKTDNILASNAALKATPAGY